MLIVIKKKRSDCFIVAWHLSGNICTSLSTKQIKQLNLLLTSDLVTKALRLDNSNIVNDTLVEVEVLGKPKYKNDIVSIVSQKEIELCVCKSLKTSSTYLPQYFSMIALEALLMVLVLTLPILSNVCLRACHKK